MFSDDERKIFRYQVDGQDRFADPLAMNRQLTRLLEGVPGQVTSDVKSENLLVAADAMDKLLAAVRTAFGLPAFNAADGSGMVDADCIAVWNQFQDWMDGQKKSGGSGLTSAGPLAPGFYPDGLPMKPSSA